MKVTIKTWRCPAFQLEVSESEMIFEIKIRLHHHTRVPADEFELVLENVWLLDSNQKVSDYGVKEGSTLRMLFK
jgi:hypothetical protein